MHMHPPIPPAPRTVVARGAHSPANKTLIAIGVLAAVSAWAPAQEQFAELPRRTLPPTVGQSAAVALGDVNGDGHLDFVFGCNGQPGNGQQNRLCHQ